MRHFILASLFFLLLVIEAVGQESFKKNSVQIGRSGYYFGDQPFKIGSLGGFTNHGWRVYIYTPYISYSRRQFKHIGFRISIEEYRVAYCKNCIQPKPLEVTNRAFCQLQAGILIYFPVFKRFEAIFSMNGVRRYNGREYGTLKYIDHGTWLEGISFTNKLNAWGVGIVMGAKYRVYKNFSISTKGEYIRLVLYENLWVSKLSLYPQEIIKNQNFIRGKPFGYLKTSATKSGISMCSGTSRWNRARATRSRAAGGISIK
ncbi:MAG: hypothetical protein EPO28_19080 [Saprospiraceae bacterium]|nr:MAG: hypothetical protein EPO28_19080 [Saprospiraceae bacterium]